MTKQSSGPISNNATELAKMTCRRYAAQQKNCNLQDGFWNDPVWKKMFREHCIAANAILKLYSFEAILSVLQQYPKVWSLRAKFLHEPLMWAQRLIEFKKTQTETRPTENAPKTGRFRLDTTGASHNGKEEGY